MPPQTREVSAANAKVYVDMQFNAKQRVLLDFVLKHHLSVGVEKSDQKDLTPPLRLECCDPITDTVADFGNP